LSKDLEEGGENWDKLLGFVLPLVSAGIAGAVSPEVASAEGWIGVFVATLAWSLGVALATWAVVSNDLTGWPVAGAVAGSLALSAGVANLIGVGALAVDPEMTGSGPAIVQFILGFIAAAVMTYGPVGTVLGGGVGVWLGFVAARHLG